MVEKNIIVKGLKINFFQSDDLLRECTLVFLHGWASQAAHLKSLFPNNRSFVALDSPGFGNSDLPETPWAITEYADFLKHFLEKMEIKNPTLIGHSFGGSIIIKYLAGGGKAQKAILISPSGVRENGFKKTIYGILAKIFKSIFLIPGLGKLREKVREGVYRVIGSEDYIEAGKMKESYKKIIREDLRSDMKKITAKVILIWGERDAATPLAQGKIINSLIKNSKLCVVENAGHFSFIDQPENFNKIFLREIDDH
jgi:pimeloyl-ACP methyl ester carboxylesterase